MKNVTLNTKKYWANNHEFKSIEFIWLIQSSFSLKMFCIFIIVLLRTLFQTGTKFGVLRRLDMNFVY